MTKEALPHNEPKGLVLVQDYANGTVAVMHAVAYAMDQQGIAKIVVTTHLDQSNINPDERTRLQITNASHPTAPHNLDGFWRGVIGVGIKSVPEGLEGEEREAFLRGEAMEYFTLFGPKESNS